MLIVRAIWKWNNKTLWSSHFSISVLLRVFAWSTKGEIRNLIRNFILRMDANFIWNSVLNFIVPPFHEKSIKELTFTCPVCWALFGSPLSLPQLHFTVCPLMSVLCTATIACVADSLVENLKYSETQISDQFPPNFISANLILKVGNNIL